MALPVLHKNTLGDLHDDYMDQLFFMINTIEDRHVSKKFIDRNICILLQSHNKYIDKCFDVIEKMSRPSSSYQNIFSDSDIRDTEKIFPNMLLVREHDMSELSEFSDYSNTGGSNILPSSPFGIRNEILSTKSSDIKKSTDIKTDTFDIWDIVNKGKKELGIEIEIDIESDKAKQNICPECDAKDSMIEEMANSRIVCSKCGYEKEELLENGPEWHQYNNDDSRGEGVNRCGSFTSYYFPKSSQGTVITGICSSRINRKQKWNSNIYKENTLNKEFNIIANICAKGNIVPANENTAKFFYKKISDSKHKNGKSQGKQVIIRGINRNSIIGACVYKACETNRDPVTKKEIAKLIGQTEKKLSKGINRFEKIMKDCDDDQILQTIHDGTPEDYIEKFCPKLFMNRKQIELGITVSNNCARLKLATDHGAQSIGAGVTLLVIEYFRLDIDRKYIAKLFKTSDVTIVKIYHKIAPFVLALVDDEITDHVIKKFKVNG